MEKIVVKDAYENNLKHIDLEIPLNTFTCVTGCSGSGKSSLVFDTIYAESQRGFLEGMTGNLYGQKLMNKPKVGSIENLRPALNISQNYYNVNPRSSVGTTTGISYYLRSLFSIVNSSANKVIPESLFSFNNPDSFCTNCYGLGVETVVSESLLIPDRDKRLNEGAILYFKGANDSKETNTLLALCEHYHIDSTKKISELSKDELHTLLYSTDKIKYKINYKEGKRRKQHYIVLQGAITEIQEKIKYYDSSSPTIYSKYLEQIPCPYCHGAKLNQSILEYRLNGLNYNEIENMELVELYKWFKFFDFSLVSHEKKELVAQLINSIMVRLDSLIKLNLGYLCLSRTIPSLSSGECQRLRIGGQLNCSLRGLLYILDEPCKGLHYKDIIRIVNATKELISKGNTVIAIEHNKQYINSADNIVELGPEGGPKGGYLINFSNSESSSYNIVFRKEIVSNQYLRFWNINFRNIKNQDVSIPLGGITCFTGVSGSGKSTLANVIASCAERKGNVNCEFFEGAGLVKKVVYVNQKPIGKTPRSTIVSYLEIYDEIRLLFSKTPQAKKLRYNASHFSMNIKGGRCECCQGTGLQKIELNYLPSSYITCPKCEGKRFDDKILSCYYNGKNIYEILDTPIDEVVSLFIGNKKIHDTLDNMIKLGLGYLRLGQMSMNLSGGEAQRIKLAKALSVPSNGKTLYVLDEPTSGLNDVDINRLSDILNLMRDNHETILIIEHNIEFIAKMSDYIVDLGLKGGNLGGKIVAQGNPMDVFSNSRSSLNGIIEYQ